MGTDEATDYHEPEPSERHRLADDLARFLRDAGLYQGEPVRSGDRSYWLVEFGTGKGLAGVVRVYSPAWISVAWQDGRRKGSRVLGSGEDALAFLRAAFVDHDWETATQVPERGG